MLELILTEVRVGRPQSRNASFDSSQALVVPPRHILQFRKTHARKARSLPISTAVRTPLPAELLRHWAHLGEDGVIEFASVVAGGGQRQTLGPPRLKAVTGTKT